MLIKSFVILALLWASNAVHAQDFDSVVVTNDCHLAKAGSFNSAIIYRGAKTTMGCEIVVKTKSFEKQYSHCALSGVYKGSDGGHICRFGTRDADGVELSFVTAKATCEFICSKQAEP